MTINYVNNWKKHYEFLSFNASLPKHGQDFRAGTDGVFHGYYNVLRVSMTLSFMRFGNGLVSGERKAYKSKESGVIYCHAKPSAHPVPPFDSHFSKCPKHWLRCSSCLLNGWAVDCQGCCSASSPCSLLRPVVTWSGITIRVKPVVSSG